MSDDDEPASPTCFLPHAPDGYGFAKNLSEAEISALLETLRDLVKADDVDQARRRMRESLPLIGKPALRTAIAVLVEKPAITLADLGAMPW